MKAVISGPAEGLEGELGVPGDKSISHRAAIVAALSRGTTAIEGFSGGADCASTLRCLEALGVDVARSPGSVTVVGRELERFNHGGADLDAGNSATTMRLLAGVVASQPLDLTLTGDESLLRRPMARIIEPLAMMGATVDAADDEGHPPLRVRGGSLRGIDYSPLVASAQVKSAVLLAGVQACGVTTVREKARTRDHTERMLRRAGISVKVDGLSVTVEPGVPVATEVRVPGDFSSAAFLITAALLCPGSCLRVRGVGLNPTRIGFLEILLRMGADVSVALDGDDVWEPRGDIMVRHGSLVAVDVYPEDVALAIDEIPLVALLATAADGVTVIRGARELRHKESDRIAGTVRGLAALGAEICERPDGMEIRGSTRLAGARTTPMRDHRLAMTFAVAGLAAHGETTVDEWEWTEISYPGFLSVLKGVGADVASE